MRLLRATHCDDYTAHYRGVLRHSKVFGRLIPFLLQKEAVNSKSQTVKVVLFSLLTCAFFYRYFHSFEASVGSLSSICQRQCVITGPATCYGWKRHKVSWTGGGKVLYLCWTSDVWVVDGARTLGAMVEAVLPRAHDLGKFW
jgi:hypothetical protein